MNPDPAVKPVVRVGSIDAYRGLVMFLMMAEVLSTGAVSRAFPDSWFWRFVAHHQDHVDWVGCSLHDLIQPSFSFLVGVALPFSIASRMAKGQAVFGMTLHAFWRAFLLGALGIFLRSIGGKMTNYTFEDTLTQIGLGYPILFLAGFASRKWQWGLLGLLLVGYWAAFAWYPLPGPDFDWKLAGVAADWPHNLSGFAAHWNKNTNFAWAFDRWFMNLFPRDHEFTRNGGGYSTLSFIPTLGTMVLGLLAGGWLRADLTATEKVKRFLIAGFALLGLGWFLGVMGICPVVKRIWTPAWVCFSGGWCFLLLAGFYALVDMASLKTLVFPLTVIGMNSIAAYCIAHLFVDFIRGSLNTHLPTGWAGMCGAGYAPFVEGAAVLSLMWLMLFWMYRRKLFLRI